MLSDACSATVHVKIGLRMGLQAGCSAGVRAASSGSILPAAKQCALRSSSKRLWAHRCAPRQEPPSSSRSFQPSTSTFKAPVQLEIQIWASSIMDLNDVSHWQYEVARASTADAF
jgi:hypothetical protein